MATTSPWKTAPIRDEQLQNKPKFESSNKAYSTTATTSGNTNASMIKTHDIRCSKCHGWGHIASQCVNKMVMVINAQGEFESEKEEEVDDEQNAVIGNLLVANQFFNVQVKKKERKAEVEKEEIEKKGKSEKEEKERKAEVEKEEIEKKRMAEKENEKKRMNEKEIEKKREPYLNLDETKQSLPSLAISLLQEFDDVLPKEMPNGFFEHKIDFLFGDAIPNQPAYRRNLEETNVLQRQVEDLTSKGQVKESMIPCAELVLIVPKKDGMWGMCVNCQAINNFMVKIRGRILLRRGGMMRTKVSITIKKLETFKWIKYKIKEAMQGLVQST